jgi:hypothetical protein
MNRLAPEIAAALEALSVPYELRKGGKHTKILVNGRLAAVVPGSGYVDRDRRATQNTLAQIRRAAAGHFARDAAK